MQKKPIRHQKYVWMICLFIGFFLFAISGIHAQVDLGLNEVGQEIGLGTTDIRVTIANIIRIFLGLLGIIAISIILYAGFLWMTAGGNQDRIAQAKKWLINASIGLVIVLSSYGIATFIFNTLGIGTGLQFGEFEQQIDYNYDGGFRGGALGGGIIESHYPGRNAVNIARNTKIIITFKEEMRLSDLIIDGADNGDVLGDSITDRINPDNIIISRSNDLENGPFITNVGIVSQDEKTFVLDPDDLLGDPNETIKYTVKLGQDLLKKDGKKAFGNFQGYNWTFEVSTVIDTTPPKILRAFPTNQSTDNARNSIVQIEFDEAIDPTTVSGTFPPFDNIRVQDGNTVIEGRYLISNQYKTVEYMTNDLCGTNSCGSDIFCLPANLNVQVNVFASDILQNGNEAQIPYNGVVDMAGNSLDGNGDGTSQGRNADNFTFTFSTNDEIDLTPPVIEIVNPDVDESQVMLDEAIFAQFSKLMMNSTINTSNITLYLEDIAGNLLPSNLAYWTGTARTSGDPIKTRALLFHEVLDPNSTYTMEISSDVKDVLQNCFKPSVGP